MSEISRRQLITRGLAAAAGLSGLAVADHIADRYGLFPPDGGGVYGPGETLTYAVHRILTRLAVRTLLRVANDLLRLASLTLRSRAQLTAEHLFLWKYPALPLVDPTGQAECCLYPRVQIWLAGTSTGFSDITGVTRAPRLPGGRHAWAVGWPDPTRPPTILCRALAMSQ